MLRRCADACGFGFSDQAVGGFADGFHIGGLGWVAFFERQTCVADGQAFGLGGGDGDEGAVGVFGDLGKFGAMSASFFGNFEFATSRYTMR